MQFRKLAICGATVLTIVLSGDESSGLSTISYAPIREVANSYTATNLPEMPYRSFVPGVAKEAPLVYSPEPAPEIHEPREISRGYPNGVALTFDCGPWVERSYIERILSALEGYRVTFFVTGIFIEKHPDIFKRIAENHDLANHSYSHPHLLNLSDEEIRNELRKAGEISSSFGYSLKPLWRAPFGERNDRIREIAAEEGYPVHVFWTRDSGDWRDISPEEVMNNVLRNADNGYIIVQHCNSWQTAEVLPDIITGLENIGLEITTVSRVITP